MSINLKALSTTEQLAEIIVDKNDVSKSFQDVLKLFQKDSDLKGFRKGKVPLNVIESRYSKEILEELKTRLISFYIRKASVDNKINVVRTSNLEHDDIKKDSDFTFKVNLEIIPEIKLKPYKEISVDKEIQKVTKKDIDEAMKNVLNNFAQNEEVESKRKIKKKIMIFSKCRFFDMYFSKITFKFFAEAFFIDYLTDFEIMNLSLELSSILLTGL